MNDVESTEGKFEIFQLWKEYEQVAMHFNGLLIKLRAQALAGVAGISAVTSLFAKNTIDASPNWEVIVFVIGSLSLFWVAIAILDLFYYNRLLWGSVKAILKIEEISKLGKSYISSIELSTIIRETEREGVRWDIKRISGPIIFYLVVLFALVGGLCWMLHRQGVFV